MVYIILGKGFEPVEAIAPCDILRRGGVDVKLAGIGGKTVEAAHGVTVAADCTVEEIDQNALEMIVLPGGLGGVESILGCQAALDAVKRAWDGGKYVAAICAGRRCWPSSASRRAAGRPAIPAARRRCRGRSIRPCRRSRTGSSSRGRRPARRSRSG